MSKTTTRGPLAAARRWAVELVDAIGLYTPKVEIAGSIRRQRDDVGDIDLVVLDTSEANPWIRHSIGGAVVGLGYEQTKDGERIASFAHPTRCSVDLYYATVETWGITLLVRTGSAAHNIKLAQIGRHRLPARRLSVARGILDTADRVVASRTEDEVFAALGMHYLDPELREAPELEQLVAAGVAE